MNQTDAIPSGLLPLRQESAAPIRGARAEEEFSALLAVAERAARRDEPGGPRDRAREAAEEFVSLVFVEPLFKQLRETSQAAPPFAPTDGERHFRAMLDAEIARDITRAAGFPLVERLARDLRRAASTDAPTPAHSASPLAGGAGV